MNKIKRAAGSRTNRTVAIAVAGAVAVAVGRHLGVDVRAIVEASGISMEDAAALAATGLGSLAVWYRARGRVADEQAAVTPRPQ